MSKRGPFYHALFSSGETTLPDGEEERKKVAQQLFGAIMVACVDVGIEGAIKLLDKDQPENSPAEGHRLRHLREELSSLTDEQREAVLKLVKDVAFGVLYWQFVKIDQFPGFDVEIRLIPRHDGSDAYSDEGAIRVVAPVERELRHQYYDWVEMFSDHPNR